MNRKNTLKAVYGVEKASWSRCFKERLVFSATSFSIKGTHLWTAGWPIPTSCATSKDVKPRGACFSCDEIQVVSFPHHTPAT